MSTLAKLIATAVAKILDSEAVVRERGRIFREDVGRRARWDWRLKGKRPEELDVIATMANMRDTRTRDDIADQNWQHARATTFAMFLLTMQMDELLRILRTQEERRGSDPEAPVCQQPVDVGVGRPVSSATSPASPSIVPGGPVCVDPGCDGRCGFRWWGGDPRLFVNADAWRDCIAGHSLNRAGSDGGRYAGWAAADRNDGDKP
jgi:hypothetical protein